MKKIFNILKKTFNKNKKLNIIILSLFLISISFILSGGIGLKYSDVNTKILKYTIDDKVYGLPYINPDWIDYNKLSEQEKANVEIIPEKYIYSYKNEDNLYGDYSKLPASFTLRDEYPTNLYDQGREGLCWSYSTASMIESNLKVTKGISEKISRNYLAILTSNKNTGYYLDRQIGSGLDIDKHFSYTTLLATGVGPAVDTSTGEVDNDYYDLDNADNYTLDDLVYSENNKYTITDFITFPKYENTEEYRNMLKSFIMKYGAIRFSTRWSTGSWYYDPTKKLMYDVNHEGTGHAMIIVGWDDNFETPNGSGAWIIQNSWSKTDGGSPYYYAYDLDSRGIQNIIGIKNIDNKTWDNNYTYLDYPKIQYEGIGTTQDVIDDYEYENGWDRYTEIDNDVVAITGTVKITYTRDKAKKEKINMINITTASQNGTFDVLISPNGDDSYKLIGEIETDLPGTYTIKPTEDIILNSDKFTIKIVSKDGAMYRYTNVFTNTVERKDESSENSIVVTKIGKNNQGNFLYRAVLYNNLPNNTKFEIYYKILEETGVRPINTINYNGKASRIIEIPYYTTPGKTINVTFKDENKNYYDYQFTFEADGYLGGMEGEGTSENPYLVTTPEQLKLISEIPTAYYKLTNDIDLSTLDPAENAYLGWTSIDEFAGTLDGDGHKIKNLYVETDNTSNAGLFKDLTNATIKNIVLENFVSSATKTYSSSALLANNVIDSNIENVSVSGNFNSRHINFILYGKNVKIDGLYINTFKSIDQKVLVFSLIGGVGQEFDPETGEIIYHESEVNNFALITNYDVIFSGIKELKNSYIISGGTIRNYSISRVDTIENVHIYQGVKENDIERVIEYNSIDEFKNKTLSELSFNTNKWTKNTSNSLPTLKNANINFINDVQVSNEMTLNIGEKRKIEYTIDPKDVFNNHLEFTSSDPSIVSVNNDGIVSAESTGTATITVKTNDGSNIEKTINVTVGSNVQVTFKYKDYEQSTAYPIGTVITLPTSNNEEDLIIGWKTEKTSQTIYEPSSEYTVNGPIKLYAEYGTNIFNNTSYVIDEEKKYIKKICLVDVNEYINNLNLTSGYTAKVYFNDEELTEGMILTNSITKIYKGNELKAEYTNSVHGDVYPDGYIGLKDVFLIIRYKMDMMELNEPQVLAADFSNDGKVKMNDAILIRNLTADGKNTGEGVCPHEN